MIENIIVTTLLVLFINVLMDKFDIYDKFEKYGMKTKFKFVHILSKC